MGKPTHDYNNPLDQIKAISYNLKRVADALEEIAGTITEQDESTSMSDTFQVKPKTQSKNQSMRQFLESLGQTT